MSDFDDYEIGDDEDDDATATDAEEDSDSPPAHVAKSARKKRK